MDVKIKRAIISVSNKTGLIPFAKKLASFGVEIISTGGTYNTLKDAGINVMQVSTYTGFPEILDGRVKTLHPTIFAGLLARYNNDKDKATLAEFGIEPIDMVVVNLYPFEETMKKENASFEEIVEQIDIGGPSMLRAAAKNFEFATVVCNPDFYDSIIKELEINDGKISRSTRLVLAASVFSSTYEYDRVISGYMNKVMTQFKPTEEEAAALASTFPRKLNLNYKKISDLRYGENPHQMAAYYVDPECKETSVLNAKQLHGKALSYNNFLDLDSALEMVRSFEEPTAAILKHTNPCGVARADSLAKAYELAYECDPISAFGSVVGFNRLVDKSTAEQISKTFVECVIAPSFDSDALEILMAKKNIRLLQTGNFKAVESGFVYKSIVGGMLVQDRDIAEYDKNKLHVVTKKEPTEEDMKGLLFAWKVTKWVKSNAIVYTTKDYTVGIGAGQMSRVDSAKLGITKANKSIKGTYLGSDAFFPFRDGVDAAAEAGVKAIIQPGGSVKDEEVIQAADEHGLIMVFTGMRHFRHG